MNTQISIEEQTKQIKEQHGFNSVKSTADRFNQKPLSVPERRALFITPEFIPFPRYSVSILTALGGSGKSFLAIQTACEHILSDYIDYNEESKVLLWLSEDNDVIVTDRLQLVADIICKYTPEEKELISRNLIIWTGSDQLPFHIVVLQNGMIVENKLIFSLFKEECKDIDLLILDPLLSFFGGDENSNPQARFFINQLQFWAAKTAKTIILLHHAGKGEDSFSRGASAFADSARFVISIEKLMMDDEKGKSIPSTKGDDKYKRHIKIKKDNNGAPALLERLGIDPDEIIHWVLPKISNEMDEAIEEIYGSSELDLINNLTKK